LVAELVLNQGRLDYGHSFPIIITSLAFHAVENGWQPTVKGSFFSYDALWGGAFLAIDWLNTDYPAPS
jgi:hypothetical protein